MTKMYHCAVIEKNGTKFRLPYRSAQTDAMKDGKLFDPKSFKIASVPGEQGRENFYRDVAARR